MKLRHLLGFLPLALLVACSSADDGNAPRNDTQLDAADVADGDTPERTPSCLTFDEKVQSALDTSVVSSKMVDGVIAITTSDCGHSEYFSGKSGLTSDLLFRIGSNTKTFVSALVLTMTSEGKLALDEPFAAYLPEVTIGQTITVRQLLNHTSGLFNYTDDPTLDFKVKATPSGLVDLALKHDAYFAPGTSWHYSNTNFILLGMIAEKIGGAPIAKQIRERFLVPHNLTHTFFEGGEEIVGELAPGFDTKRRAIPTTYDPSWAWAAGAMVATPADLGRWITLLARGEVLPKEAQTELLKGVKVNDVIEYGLGVFLFSAKATGKTPAIGHGGDIYGSHSQAFYFPASDMTLVTISDTDGVSSNDLSIAALDALP